VKQKGNVHDRDNKHTLVPGFHLSG